MKDISYLFHFGLHPPSLRDDRFRPALAQTVKAQFGALANNGAGAAGIGCEVDVTCSQSSPTFFSDINFGATPRPIDETGWWCTKPG